MASAAEQEKAVSPVDVRTRVVALALEPALTLARMAAIPLDDLQRLVAIGYFHQARERGMSFRGIARRFGKSLRTITNISKQASAQGLPLQESERITHRRQLVVLAGAAGAAGIQRDELLRTFPNADASAIEEQLQVLVEAEVLEERDGRFFAVTRHFDMVEESLAPRLESLRHFLRAVSLVAYQRFFVSAPEKDAFARVLSFSSERAPLQELRDTTYSTLRETAIAADEAAGESAQTVMAAFCVVPESADPGWRPPRK